MYSRPDSSTSRPPTSLLPVRTASITAVSGRLYAASALGLTVTWYCRTWPPTVATSATPGTAWIA